MLATFGNDVRRGLPQEGGNLAALYLSFPGTGYPATSNRKTSPPRLCTAMARSLAIASWSSSLAGQSTTFTWRGGSSSSSARKSWSSYSLTGRSQRAGTRLPVRGSIWRVASSQMCSSPRSETWNVDSSNCPVSGFGRGRKLVGLANGVFSFRTFFRLVTNRLRSVVDWIESKRRTHAANQE